MKWYYFGNLGLLKCVNVDHGICIKAFLCLTLFDLLLYKPFFLKLSLVLTWKNVLLSLYFTIFTLLPLLCSFLTHHAGLVLCQTWPHTACVCADHLRESVPSTQKSFLL